MRVDNELICRGCPGPLMGDCAVCRVFTGERVECNGCGRRFDEDDLDEDGMCAECAIGKEECDDGE